MVPSCIIYAFHVCIALVAVPCPACPGNPTSALQKPTGWVPGSIGPVGVG